MTHGLVNNPRRGTAVNSWSTQPTQSSMVEMGVGVIGRNRQAQTDAIKSSIISRGLPPRIK